MKNLIRSLTLAALALTAFALPTFAQTPAAAPAADAAAADPCKEDTRGALYKTYYDKKKGDAAAQKEAYTIGKDYLTKYNSCNDTYSKAVQKFVSQYEAAVRKLDFPKYLYGTDPQGTGRDYGQAFTIGKEMLAEDPNDLSALINLGYAGYAAQSQLTPVTTYSADANGYARKAIELIESGKTAEQWTPFKGKDDTLAYLNFAVGEYSIKNDPAGALPYYLKAVSYNSDVKNSAITYARLAVAYQAGQYEPMQAKFKTDYEGKPETDESKYALNNLNQVIDRIMDAYARAINLAGTDAKLQASKAGWKEALTGLYKFRNNDPAAAGLDAYIAGATARPLPQPFTPQPYVAPTTPTPATTSGDAGTSGMSSPAPAMSTTDTTTPGTTMAPVKPATQPAKPMSSTAPKPATKKP